MLNTWLWKGKEIQLVGKLLSMGKIASPLDLMCEAGQRWDEDLARY